MLRHAKISTKLDGPDPTKVQKTNWNAPHVFKPGWLLLGGLAFGSGGEGLLNFDGIATVAGMTPTTVGAFKVYAFTRDVFADTIVIGAGVKLSLLNWRLFCKTSLVGAGSGVSFIHCNGNDAAVAVAGGANPSGAGAAVPSGYFDVSGPGFVGGTFVANALPLPFTDSGFAAGGVGVINTSASDGQTLATHMKGGGGGGSASPTQAANGEQGGDHSIITPSAGAAGYDFNEQMLGRPYASPATRYRWASGGGFGASNVSGIGAGTNPAGGGGGSGAACCFVAAQSIVGVTISANGGRGADGVFGTGNVTQQAAGGGGGGGGCTIVHYCTRSDCVVQANGGIGGAGVLRGGGFVGQGANGSPGWTFEYNLSGDGT